MKNYFKSYYKNRIVQGVLGEQASEELKQKLTFDALTKHKNIMEGYNPNGRDSGIMNPEDRANYIKHFTNFIKESYFHDTIDVSWTEARNTHNTIIENGDSEYLLNFSDFMNSPTTTIILENSLLSEEEKNKSFKGDVIDAVRKHAKNPGKTISSSRGDNFDVFDHAESDAEHIEYYMKNADKATPYEKGKHQNRISFLKSVLPHEVVDRLIEKHFKK